MFQKLLIVLIAAGLFASVIWFIRLRSATVDVPSTKLQVVATFYPLAEFAQQVGQDLVEVKNLTPAGTEPHDFDPSPQDLAKVQNAQVLIYNGAGFEPWLSRLTPDLLQNKVVVEATNGLPLLPQSSGLDPHVWLDPVLAAEEVEAIKKGLIAADPAHQADYEQNAEKYQQQLVSLDAQFKTGLAECQSREIVTSHNAFNYLADRYELSLLTISGISPDEEPTPQKLAEITLLVRQHQVKYIFFETLVSPKLAETIAQETGAKTMAFNPLEGLSLDDLTQGENYLSVQHKNLVVLRTALSCK